MLIMDCRVWRWFRGAPRDTIACRPDEPGWVPMTVSWMSYKMVARLFVVTMVGIHIFFLWSVRDRIARADPDFTAFYAAGKILREGRGAHLYEATTQLEVQREFADDADIRQGPLSYIHPPYEALLFVPLTFLPYRVAFIFWEFLNVFFLFIICRMSRGRLSSLSQLPVWQLVLLCLAFFPVLANFHQGQDAILLLLIVTLAFRCLEQGTDFATGSWLGVGVFKYHLILPLVLILAIWRGRKLLMGFAVSALGAVLVSLGIVGWHGATQYPVYVWKVVSQPIFGGLPLRRLPNLLGLLAGWSFTDRAGWRMQLAVLACSGALLVVVTRMIAQRHGHCFSRLYFSSAVITALLLGYGTNTYDLCLLVLPLVLVADYWFGTPAYHPWQRWAGFFAVAMICLSPVWFFLWMRWDRINLMALFLLIWLFALRSEVLHLATKEEPSTQPALT